MFFPGGPIGAQTDTDLKGKEADVGKYISPGRVLDVAFRVTVSDGTSLCDPTDSHSAVL